MSRTLPLDTTAINPAVGVPGWIAAVYAFLLISRVYEFALAFGSGNLYMMLGSSILGIVAALLTGGLVRSFSSTPAKFLAAFAVWMLLATATSSWHMGSINVMRDLWFRSILTFLVVAGLATNLGRLKAVMVAAGYGGLVAGVALFTLAGSSYGRIAFSGGTFGNSNAVAYHLLFALPMSGFIFVNSGAFRKTAIIAMAAVSAIAILRTGSRGGLLIIAAQFLLLLVHVSFANKVKVLMAGAVVSLMFLTLVSDEALMRYATLARNESSDGSFASAQQSQASRMLHLVESLNMTLHHPLFGVGPGVFRSASALSERSEGGHEFWEETHNAYTQVSSECGVPGLLCFVAVLVAGWFQLSGAERIAKKAGNREIANMAFCLKLTLTAFVVNGFFTSNAYEFYLPLLAALIGSLQNASKSQPQPLVPPPQRIQTWITPRQVRSRKSSEFLRPKINNL